MQITNEIDLTVTSLRDDSRDAREASGLYVIGIGVYL